MEDFSAKRQALLDAGVKMMDPDTVYVEESVTVGPGTLLLPGTILRGKTVVGANCEIGPNTMLVDCTVGDGVTINSRMTGGQERSMNDLVDAILNSMKEA